MIEQISLAEVEYSNKFPTVEVRSFFFLNLSQLTIKRTKSCADKLEMNWLTVGLSSLYLLISTHSVIYGVLDWAKQPNTPSG